MPRAATVCASPGCPEIAIPGSSRCADHRLPAWRNPSPSSTQLNGSKWQRARARAIANAGGICEQPGCTLKATQVHHQHPVADGGSVYDPSNLQAVCDVHHKQLHRR